MARGRPVVSRSDLAVAIEHVTVNEQAGGALVDAHVDDGAFPSVRAASLGTDDELPPDLAYFLLNKARDVTRNRRFENLTPEEIESEAEEPELFGGHRTRPYFDG
jgi:hypothetical protein